MYARVVRMVCFPFLAACLVSCGGPPPTPVPPVPPVPQAGQQAPVQPATVTIREVSLPTTVPVKDPAFPAGGFFIDKNMGWAWSAGAFRGPNVLVPEGEDVEVILRLEGNFPPGVNPKLRVMAGGQRVLTTKLAGKALHDSKMVGPIKVPASLHRGRLDLTWQVDTWAPAELKINPDTRRLGLDVASAEIRKGQ